MVIQNYMPLGGSTAVDPAASSVQTAPQTTFNLLPQTDPSLQLNNMGAGASISPVSNPGVNLNPGLISGGGSYVPPAISPGALNLGGSLPNVGSVNPGPSINPGFNLGGGLPGSNPQLPPIGPNPLASNGISILPGFGGGNSFGPPRPMPTPQPPAPQPQPQVQPAPQGQNVEQNALAGGGVDNKQQISNFMTALNNVHAGSNNAFANSPAPVQNPVGNLIDPNAAYANNAATQANSQTGQTSGGNVQINANSNGFLNPGSIGNFLGNLGTNVNGVNLNSVTGFNLNSANPYGYMTAQNLGINLPGMINNTGIPVNGYQNAIPSSIAGQTPAQLLGGLAGGSQPGAQGASLTGSLGGVQGLVGGISGSQPGATSSSLTGSLGGVQNLAGGALTGSQPGVQGASLTGSLGGVQGLTGGLSGGSPTTSGVISPSTTTNLGNLSGALSGSTQSSPITANTNNFNLNGGLLMSDETKKTNVESAKPDIMQFLNAIGAHNYTYKQPDRDGRGTFTSPMAQELEKTHLGKQAVINTPRGKMVDYARLSGVNLAAVSVVHRETQKLQEQFNALKRQLGKRK